MRRARQIWREFIRHWKRRQVNSIPLVALATVMLIAGLGFRLTAVPFSTSTPLDVFQGAPASGAAMLSFVPKIAGVTAGIAEINGSCHGS